MADGADRPIGVFDSGVGGLSVLRALHAELPHERFVYVADSGNAPYGERDDDFVMQRSHAIANHLLAEHQIKALVVACNTATAAAIKGMRAAHASLPLVGIEPALKPAAATSQTRNVGVMATRGTLHSEKFQALLASLHGQTTFVLQPCDGLAIAIERNDMAEIEALCERYTAAMGLFGQGPEAMDTLVLGCTHYPFVESVLRRSIGDKVTLLEGGAPVARHTRRLLEAAGLLATGTTAAAAITQFFTTGAVHDLRSAAARWLQLDARVSALAV